MNKLYGISNCDTVKKAKSWLNDASVDFEFIDFRKDGLDTDKVRHWVKAVGIELLLNKRGTTWRNLSEEQKAIADNDQLVELMAEHPTLIKRPVFEWHSTGGASSSIKVGFKPDQYQTLFQ